MEVGRKMKMPCCGAHVRLQFNKNKYEYVVDCPNCGSKCEMKFHEGYDGRCGAIKICKSISLPKFQSARGYFIS